MRIAEENIMKKQSDENENNNNNIKALLNRYEYSHKKDGPNNFREAVNAENFYQRMQKVHHSEDKNANGTFTARNSRLLGMKNR